MARPSRIEEKKAWLAWLEIPPRLRQPSNENQLAKKLGISPATITLWRKSGKRAAELAKKFNPTEFFEQHDRRAHEELNEACEQGDMQALRTYFKEKERLASEKKGDNGHKELTADIIAKAIFGVEQELRNGGYPIQGEGMGEVPEVPDILPHEIRKG